MRLTAPGIVLLAAGLAAAQAPPPAPETEAPATPDSGKKLAAPPGGHHLGGGFKGSTSAPSVSSKPKPPAAAAGPPSKPAPVKITNATVGEGPAGVPKSAPKPVPLAAAAPASTAAAPPAPIAGITDFQGHDEAYWRERARASQDRLDKARQRVVSLEADVHRLENDFYGWDDGQYRDRVIKPEWDRTKQDLEDAKAEVVAAQTALDNISEDARKAGALPGWLRQ